jgi:hypothetical protein
LSNLFNSKEVVKLKGSGRKGKRSKAPESMGRLRPVGHIKIIDPRGYAYFPRLLRKEVNAKGKDEIPFFLDANCVLLVRKDANLRQVLEGLEVLKRDLLLRVETEAEGPVEAKPAEEGPKGG